VRQGPAVRQDLEIPLPPDLKLHVLRNCDLDEIFRHINPVMLYTRHLGLKNFEKAFAQNEPKAVELRAQVEAVQETILARPDISANAVYKFFAAQSDGERMLIVSPDGNNVIETFVFARQSDEPGLCLADYVAPRAAGRIDYICMFATAIGDGVRALAEEWKAKGEYLRSHILQVLALEGAEASAELLHKKIRQMWGIGDPPGLTMKDLFQARYHGKRFSFGYPACPRLEDQACLFRLLAVEENIGVHLTEGYMMDPESAVTALVFHHPEAKYFSLSPSDIERFEREVSRPGEQPGAG
ncbi:MAG: vitamin B12 dependent-methionine synthase activation domain-containing protein, partial [Candidatus Binataceae bacterium]